MKRKYYVYYYKNFRNTYDLYYTENEENAKKMEDRGMQRITRREAVKLCREEKYRRENPSFAYFASATIKPWDEHDLRNYEVRYYVWEKKK